MKNIVRRVLPSEYHKYRIHLKSLDTESKFLRFGFTITDAMIDKLCDGFEQHPEKHVLFCVENASLEFIAIGHIGFGESTDLIELAFSVLNQYQGKGLGDLVMKRCIRYCRTHNIQRGYMMCLSQNTAIKHLCTKNEITFENSQGEAEANIQFADPSVSTYINENINDSAALFDYMGKRVLYPWTLASKTLESILK